MILVFCHLQLVHSVSILREVVAEQHPTVTVYPRCEEIQTDDENLTIGDRVSLASLQQLPIWSLIALAQAAQEFTKNLVMVLRSEK